MQGLHFVFLAVVLTAHTVLSMSMDEIMAACIKENNFHGDIEKLDMNDASIPKAAKCTLACSLEKHGVMKADGSIDKEKEKEMTIKLVKNEEMKKKLLDAIDECDVSAKSDKCEAAFEFMKCRKSKAGKE